MNVTVDRAGEFDLSQDSFGPLPRARISQQGITARFAVLLLPMAEGINSSAFEATMEGDVARARVSINGESEHIKFDLSDRNGPWAGDERVEVRFSVGD